MTHPLITDLINELNLTPYQAQGAVGLILTQLKKHISETDFRTVECSLPTCQELMNKAPKSRHSFLSGLASSLGGDKGKLLMDLRQGLQDLDIPTDLHRPLADTLKSSFETHYPELKSVMEKVQA